MKAILEFDLPEEEVAHRLAVSGADYAAVCTDIDNRLRSCLKYGHDFKDVDEVLEGIRQYLHECLEVHGLSLEGL